MDYKINFTFKNVNMTKDEFINHYSLLLRNAIFYTKLYMINLHNKYYELKLNITPLRKESMTDEIKEKIKRYEKTMLHYKDCIKELELLQGMEAKASNLNDCLEVMKLFNEFIIENYKNF